MRHKTHERCCRRWQRCSGLTFFRARYRSQVVSPPDVMSAAAKKNGTQGDPEEALPLQMLDCSRDRGERKFETHREEVDHAVRATVSGDQERPSALHFLDDDDERGCPLEQRVLAILYTVRSHFGSASRVGRRQVEKSTTLPM